MTHPTDEQIAKEALKTARPIAQIAQKLGLLDEMISPYGKYKAKIDPKALQDLPNKSGKLVLVTAINPTPMGEGKTTITVGLTDALSAELANDGKVAMMALREPSLGPVFGIKGGATGGGQAQIIPMEDINLHFTGDFHAITSANNLLSAMIDNHIHQGNLLGINPKRVVHRRVLDINDRQLRHIMCGMGKSSDGVLRPDGFDITVASEVMAVFCLASDLDDLKHRLGQMVVAYRFDDTPVFAKDLQAHGAMTALLKEAFSPNLVQSLMGTPALVHGGPFANIAHGCNSLIATKMATHLADVVVTEAGFGADLGAEKFCDIKCRLGHLRPDACVIVATTRALKYHGGANKADLNDEHREALLAGLPNLLAHIDTMQNVYGLPVVVAINRFVSDTPAELEALIKACQDKGVEAVVCEAWQRGAVGAKALAQVLLKHLKNPADFKFAYDNKDTIEQKITKIAQQVYGADGVVFGDTAKADMKRLSNHGFGDLPVCMAKTQYSLSDNPKLLGRPTGFEIVVRSVSVSAGAGFVVAMCGDIMKMPGLPKNPSAHNIDVIDGQIVGLF